MCLQISSTDSNYFVFRYAGFYWGWKKFLLMDDSKNDNHQYQLLPPMLVGEKYSVYQAPDGLLIFSKNGDAIQPVQFIFNFVPEELATLKHGYLKVAASTNEMKLGCHIAKIGIKDLCDIRVPDIEYFNDMEDISDHPARTCFSSFVCFTPFHIQMVGDYDFVVSKFLLPTPKLLDNFMSDVFQKFWAVNGKLGLKYNKVAYEYFYDKVIKGE